MCSCEPTDSPPHREKLLGPGPTDRQRTGGPGPDRDPMRHPRPAGRYHACLPLVCHQQGLPRLYGYLKSRSLFPVYRTHDGASHAARRSPSRSRSLATSASSTALRVGRLSGTSDEGTPQDDTEEHSSITGECRGHQGREGLGRPQLPRIRGRHKPGRWSPAS